MIWGFGILFNYKILIFMIASHLWIGIIFYRSYLNRLTLPAHIKILSGIGFISLLVVISGLWFRYFGNGLISDLEYFWYLQ